MTACPGRRSLTKQLRNETLLHPYRGYKLKLLSKSFPTAHLRRNVCRPFFSFWWRRLDSNQRPRDYETLALAT